jgi:hypothetical protein
LAGDNDDLDLTGLDDEDETEDTDDQESEDEEESASDDDPKRVRDLQSAKDKETARANKLQKELDALKQQATGKPGEKPKAVDPQLAEWQAELKTQVRTQFYESDPRFKEYGLSPDLITGSSPAEMRASLQALKKMVTKIESVARKKVLEETGAAPDLMGGGTVTTGPAKDFSKMSSEEFNKYLESQGISL